MAISVLSSDGCYVTGSHSASWVFIYNSLLCVYHLFLEVKFNSTLKKKNQVIFHEMSNSLQGYRNLGTHYPF